MHMLKAQYQNTITELSIGITSSFSGIALNAFWEKELFIWVSIGIQLRDYVTPALHSTYIILHNTEKTVQ